MGQILGITSDMGKIAQYKMITQILGYIRGFKEDLSST